MTYQKKLYIISELLASPSIDSVVKMSEKYFPQVYLEGCNANVKIYQC